jgi:hypothetical protein
MGSHVPETVPDPKGVSFLLFYPSIKTRNLGFQMAEGDGELTCLPYQAGTHPRRRFQDWTAQNHDLLHIFPIQQTYLLDTLWSRNHTSLTDRGTWLSPNEESKKLGGLFGLVVTSDYDAWQEQMERMRQEAPMGWLCGADSVLGIHSPCTPNPAHTFSQRRGSRATLSHSTSSVVFNWQDQSCAVIMRAR